VALPQYKSLLKLLKSYYLQSFLLLDMELNTESPRLVKLWSLSISAARLIPRKSSRFLSLVTVVGFVLMINFERRQTVHEYKDLTIKGGKKLSVLF